MVNLVFFVVMVVGIVLAEVLFPLQGIRGGGGDDSILNDTKCLNDTPGERLVDTLTRVAYITGANWVHA